MSKKNLSMQFRVDEAEAETIKRKAERADMNVSKYLRTMALSDEKLVILEKGGEISSLMSSLHIDIHDAVIHNKVNTLDSVTILNRMEKVAFLLSEVLTEISPFSDYSTDTKEVEY